MILRWKDTTHAPIETDDFTPENLLPLAPAELARRPLLVGNQTAEFGDLFTIEPTDNPFLTLEGNLRHIRGLGRKMASGHLILRGQAGPYLGAEMIGGRIDLHGDAADYAGAEMRGGLIHIHGHAADLLGASYPGSRLGMRDGMILVDGDAGDQAGRKMRRGLIAVSGAVGEGFGHGLIAGSLFALGSIGNHAGAGMKRGTIALLARENPELFPSFAPAGRYQFPFLRLYLRRLAALGLPVPSEVLSGSAERYNGDLAEGGKGEILLLS